MPFDRLLRRAEATAIFKAGGGALDVLRLLPAICALLLGAMCGPTRADGLVIDELRLPVVLPGLAGPSTYELEAVLVRPDDTARHPLAVISHGSLLDRAERRELTPQSMIPQAAEFARRGWTTLVFMRRGYGASEGQGDEDVGQCDMPFYKRAGQATATEIRAAISAIAANPAVDPDRIIVIGHSGGGFGTVALTANDPPPGLVAAISFAGGRGAFEPGLVCKPEALVAAFHAYGRTSRIPMLWVYAANDRSFPLQLARRFYTAFRSGGGVADFVAAPAFGQDGHALFVALDGIPIWTPYVDRFLVERQLQLRQAPIPPEAGTPTPPPGWLQPPGLAAFQQFLANPIHRAFAVSPDGAWGWRAGRRSTDEAKRGALANCAAHDRSCRVYMIDNDLVR